MHEAWERSNSSGEREIQTDRHKQTDNWTDSSVRFMAGFQIKCSVYNIYFTLKVLFLEIWHLGENNISNSWMYKAPV